MTASTQLSRERFYELVHHRNISTELTEYIENNIDNHSFQHYRWFVTKQTEIFRNKQKIINYLLEHNIIVSISGIEYPSSQLAIQYNHCVESLFKKIRTAFIKHINADQLERLIDLHIVLNDSLDSLIEIFGHNNDSCE